MKAFIVTRNAPGKDFIGGAELQAWLITKYLRKDYGWETLYVALEGETVGKETRDDAEFCYLSSKGEEFWRSFRRFSELIREEKPDLCYIRDFRYLFPLAVVAWMRGIPVVYNTTHEKNLYFYCGWQGVKGTLLHALSFIALHFVTVITNNESHAKNLATRGIKATAIMNSIEDNYREGIAKKKRVVWVANLKPRKRPELFIELAGRFRGSGYEFVMIGHLQADTARYLRLIDEESTYNPNFRYMGGLSLHEVDEILAESEIFVSTCKPEGFPNNIIQACFAKCVIVSFNYDPDGVLRRYAAGYVPKTFDSMVEVIQNLMAGNADKEMAERARAYALEHHSIRRNMARFNDVFQNIAASR